VVESFLSTAGRSFGSFRFGGTRRCDGDCRRKKDQGPSGHPVGSFNIFQSWFYLFSKFVRIRFFSSSFVIHAKSNRIFQMIFISDKIVKDEMSKFLDLRSSIRSRYSKNH
jgi:hypothetical protein